MNKNLQKKEGFTLIELAIVLVVIGLLVGLGTSLIGPLTKQTKVVESREVVKNARAALLGYAVKNGYLPLSTDPDPLGLAGARKMDAWGKDLKYYVATSLDGAGNACGTTTTNIVVHECTNDECTSYNTKSNIAFIVYSTGGDADNACTGTASPFKIWLQGSGYNSPCSYTTTNPAYQYDDLIQYVTLDEIRSAMGCSFTTTTPSTPGAVTATPISTSSVRLDWAPVTTNTDLSTLWDLKGYNIYRGLAANPTTLYAFLQNNQTTGTVSYIDTNAGYFNTYYYRITAVNKTGIESGYSAGTSAPGGYGSETILQSSALTGWGAVTLSFNVYNNGPALTITYMYVCWGTSGTQTYNAITINGGADLLTASKARCVAATDAEFTNKTLNAGLNTIAITWSAILSQATYGQTIDVTFYTATANYPIIDLR